MSGERECEWRMNAYNVLIIGKGKAYVCSLSADEIREYRGTLREYPHTVNAYLVVLTCVKDL
jgi:glutamyl/glutaminyl-tRNA synthetase